MQYTFTCSKCNKEEQKEIPINEYDTLKDKQVCSKCGSKMTRKIEWGGAATGSGDGWFGKSGGSKTI